ncbi:MAG: sulfurtransferase TusA family protein [Gammaproteobacteria bacterium]|nr:sulfurtransferase TusA family protein [Gammaproteobacteria bacterium]
MNRETFDLKGLICPLPVIRTQNKIKTLNSGDILVVLCSDPGALHDIPAWCRIHGHEIIDSQNKEGEITLTIKVVH